jgi:hypothetical protein
MRQALFLLATVALEDEAEHARDDQQSDHKDNANDPEQDLQHMEPP